LKRRPVWRGADTGLSRGPASRRRPAAIAAVAAGIKAGAGKE